MGSKNITQEKKIETYIRKVVKSLGGDCIKIECNYRSGLPDRLCIIPGKLGKMASIFFVEVKSLGFKPSKIQLKTHQELKACGAMVFVIDSSEAFDKLLDKIR